MTRVCPVCDTEADPEDRSCRYCRRTFLPGDFERRTRPPPDLGLEDAPRPRRSLWPFAFIVLGVSATAAALFYPDSVKTTAGRLVEALPFSPKPQPAPPPQVPGAVPADGAAVPA